MDRRKPTRNVAMSPEMRKERGTNVTSAGGTRCCFKSSLWSVTYCCGRLYGFSDVIIVIGKRMARPTVETRFSHAESYSLLPPSVPAVGGVIKKGHDA